MRYTCMQTRFIHKYMRAVRSAVHERRRRRRSSGVCVWLSNVYKHTEREALKANEQIYIPFFLRKPQTLPNGATIVFFSPCGFVHPFSLQWRPEVSRHTQTHTDTHQGAHKKHFWPRFPPLPPLSICGVFKHQSRVV